jgi:branched-chain amino acid transport system substrate-binding protein
MEPNGKEKKMSSQQNSNSRFGISRRSVVKGAGGTTLLGSLAGCSALVPSSEGESGGGESSNTVSGQDSIPSEPLTIAMVTFTSGAASVLGQPAANSAQMFADQLNEQGGVLGQREIEIEIVDEAGENTVRRFRELANDDNIDFIHGYISSANMLSVAPVAEDLNQLLMILDAGSSELFEEEVTDPEWVFRGTAHAANGALGAAQLVARDLPEASRIAGINPDYAWGRSSMELFQSALEQLAPDVEFVSIEWPELGATDYGPFISSMINSDPDFVYTSLWGGDLVTFFQQALDRNLFDETDLGAVCGTNAMTAMGTDMPEGVYVTGRGPGMPGILPHNPLHTQFVDAYQDRYGNPPFGYTAFEAWQGLKLYVSAVERAYRILGRYPEDEELIPVLENSSVDGPQGWVALAGANGHQAIEAGVYAQTTSTGGEYLGFENQSWLPLEQVMPPEEITTREWISQFNSVR